MYVRRIRRVFIHRYCPIILVFFPELPNPSLLASKQPLDLPGLLGPGAPIYFPHFIMIENRSLLIVIAEGNLETPLRYFALDLHIVSFIDANGTSCSTPKKFMSRFFPPLFVVP